MFTSPEMLAPILDEVGQIYRELETRQFERSCIRRGECCHFGKTGRVPMLTLGESIYLANGVRAAGWKELPERSDGFCPLFSATGGCRAYGSRPFGCRTHYCAAAGGIIPRDQLLPLIRRLEVLDGRLNGSGPRALPPAVSEVLELWPARGRGSRGRR